MSNPIEFDFSNCHLVFLLQVLLMICQEIYDDKIKKNQIYLNNLELQFNLLEPKLGNYLSTNLRNYEYSISKRQGHLSIKLGDKNSSGLFNLKLYRLENLFFDGYECLFKGTNVNLLKPNFSTTFIKRKTHINKLNFILKEI